jgi:hypothetical protein
LLQVGWGVLGLCPGPIMIGFPSGYRIYGITLPSMMAGA